MPDKARRYRLMKGGRVSYWVYVPQPFIEIKRITGTGRIAEQIAVDSYHVYTGRGWMILSGCQLERRA